MSPVSLACIVGCFFLPFMDFRCNNVSLKEFTGMELAMGTNMKLKRDVELPKDESISVESELDNQHIERNYFALVALVLAVAGCLLSLLLSDYREVVTGLIGFAGLLALLIMRIQIDHSIETESAGYGKFIINLQYVYGYWLSVALFAFTGAYNLLTHIDQRQASLRKKESSEPMDEDN